MKVHLIKEKTLHDFTVRNSRSKVSLENWIGKLRMANWNGPGDIKKTYASADLLGNGSNRVIFNIAGNSYRMIGKYAFGSKRAHLFICWIGTHAEYDKLCSKGEQYEINTY